MRFELFVPFAYSIVREMRRYHLTTLQSIVRVGANFTQYYLWIPLFAMLMTGHYACKELLCSLAAFIILYEAGYIMADTLGIHFEHKKLKHVVYKKVNLLAVTIGIVFRMALVLLLIPKEWLIPFAVTFDVFLLHSILREKYRLATFPAFILIKGLVPFTFILSLLSHPEMLIVLAGVIGTMLYETMEYYSRKNLGKTEEGFLDNKNSLRRFLVVLVIMGTLTGIFGLPIPAVLLALLLYSLNHLLFTFLYDTKERFL